ncbi:phospholipid carrier-dependent glycosyltransferase [bacterium]|nr:phospholipid carrier-dependent glycosyltransferase [bacterium]
MSDAEAVQTSVLKTMEPRWPRSVYLKLLGLMLVELLLRVPVITHQLPAQDEDFFAVPGYTILQDGVPRVPYLPSRDPTSAFYRSDEVLFTLPPAYFYWQALWYVILEPTTSVARLASLITGLMLLPLLYELGWRLTGRHQAAWWGVMLYALSRAFMFPSINGRPDLMCAMLGIAALVCIERLERTLRNRWLVVAGLLIGVGFMTHPFALVYALQCGVWVLLIHGRWWQRLGRGAALVGLSIVGASPWGLLIAKAPDLFHKQFFNNVLNRTGPGLPSRMISPGYSFEIQTPLFIDHVGPLQVALVLGGIVLLIATIGMRWRRLSVDGKRRELLGWIKLAVLAVSSIYLLVVCQGAHPSKGYWCYPMAIGFLCTGVCIDGLLQVIQTARLPRVVQYGLVAAVSLTVLVAMVPGSGVRTTWVYLSHWHELNYHAPTFTRMLMEETPKEGVVIVDPGYVFDFYRAGYDARLALIFDFFYNVEGVPYEYVVGGPYSIRDRVPDAVKAVQLREFGDRSNPFTCYARLYRSPDAASQLP